MTQRQWRIYALGLVAFILLMVALGASNLGESVPTTTTEPQFVPGTGTGV